MQDVQKTGMSQDGGIRTVTTDMRNTRLAERVLQVVKATWEAGITGKELAQAIPGFLATTIRRPRARDDLEDNNKLMTRI